MSTTLNQTTGGDEWYQIAVVPPAPFDNAYIRVKCADAVGEHTGLPNASLKTHKGASQGGGRGVNFKPVTQD